MPSDNQSLGQLELSIIIISYNTAKITIQTLNSIFQTYQPENHHSFEIIVLDNASTDDSVLQIKMLQKLHPQLKLILSSDNLGFSKGNNKAVQSARGKYLLFLNSDIIVLDHAIDSLLDSFRSHLPHAEFAGGKLLNADMTDQSSCGRFFTLPVVCAALFLKGDYWGLTRCSPNTMRFCDWVSGACLLTMRVNFDRLGGFDEGIFMYMEEVDLLYRAQSIGMKTLFVPSARFIHLGNASSGARSFPIQQVFNGLIYFYKKHHDRKKLQLLRYMLQLKARLAILIGRLTHRTDLIQTYEKALTIAQMA